MLNLAAERAQDFIARMKSSRIGTGTSLADLRRCLNKPLNENGLSGPQVIEELVKDAAAGLVGSAAGRFFGWVIGGSLPVAVAADWLAAAWDQNAALYACSPAAAVVEETAGAWIKDLLGLPVHASFAFVTGCQMAHVTCLAAARGALLRTQGWDPGTEGLSGAPRIRILVGETGHASLERAASLLGLGRNNVELLATDSIGRIRIEAAAEALKDGCALPTILVLQAGDIATGAFDCFEAVIPLARRAGAWVHIDGAFGLWARASARYRHLAKGCERADSWATDGHKVLNTPFDCGYAFVAHPEDHRSEFSLRASYLTHDEEARDQIDWNPDWSRRARGFPTYAALRFLGRHGVGELFETLCRHARSLAAGLAQLPGVEIVSEPIINQALVRILDPHPDANDADHDVRTDAVIEAVNATGEAFFSGTTWRGRRVMRISVCNWRTDNDDLARAIAALRGVLTSNATATAPRLGPDRNALPATTSPSS